jgi:hypothetical protein
MRFLRRLARAVTEVDRAPISLTSAWRCGVFEAVLLGTAVATDRLTEAVPAAVGLLFVCMGDPPSTDARRARSAAWFVLWATVVMLVAGAVSEAPVPHLVVGLFIAFGAGYAGTLGAVGSLYGTLVLVVFSIFAGTPVHRTQNVQDALVLGGAAAIGGCIIAAPSLLRRARGPRAAFARVVRGFAHVDVTDPLSVGTAVQVGRERELEEIVAAESLAPETRAWLEALAAAAHRGRLSMLALSGALVAVGGGSDDAGATGGTDETERAAVAAYLAAVSRCWRAAGAAIVWPQRRRVLRRVHATVRPANDALAAVSSPVVTRVAADLLDALDTVVALVDRDWPLGRRGERRDTGTPRRSVWERAAATGRVLRTHLDRSDPFLRHAVRLAVTFTIATALTEGLDFRHAYWLPMTVAWISKPAMGDTTVRVTARMTGTVIGVIIAAVVIGLGDPGSWVLAVLIAGSAVVVITFLFANYASAVTGITCFVFFLFVLEGTVTDASFPGRLLATALAGVIVLIGAFVWPTRAGSRVDVSLSQYADALGAYVGPVLDGSADAAADGEAARRRVADARIRATIDLQATELEVFRHRLHPDTAHALLEHLHLATSQGLATELSGTGPSDRVVSREVVGELTDLRTRLDAVAAGRGVPPRVHPPEVDHPVHRSVRHAHRALDADAERQARADPVRGRNLARIGGRNGVRRLRVRGVRDTVRGAGRWVRPGPAGCGAEGSRGFEGAWCDPGGCGPGS